jgi:hypothetical protein
MSRLFVIGSFAERVSSVSSLNLFYVLLAFLLGGTKLTAWRRIRRISFGRCCNRTAPGRTCVGTSPSSRPLPRRSPPRAPPSAEARALPQPARNRVAAAPWEAASEVTGGCALALTPPPRPPPTPLPTPARKLTPSFPKSQGPRPAGAFRASAAGTAGEKWGKGMTLRNNFSVPIIYGSFFLPPSPITLLPFRLRKVLEPRLEQPPRRQLWVGRLFRRAARPFGGGAAARP